MNTKLTLRPSPDALLNPRCDAIFKTLFTHNSKEGRLALKSFLEAVFNAEVTNIQLVQNELPIESEHDKQSIFDITCMLNGTDAVNIEIQGINVDNSYDKRAEYQVAHLLNHTIKKGDDWVDMPKAFQISVLNFIYDKETAAGISVYTMKTELGHTLSNRMAIIFIELPKYKDENKSYNRSIKNLTAVEKWCKFLLYADDGTRQNLVNNLCKSDGGIMAASGILAQISQDDVNWVRQTSRDMWERDQRSIKHSKERAERELKEKLYELKETKNELSEVKTELSETKTELSEAKNELSEAKTELSEAKISLAEKDAQILELQEKLKSTFNSRAED